MSKNEQKELKEKASLYLDNIADASAFVFNKLLHIDVKPRQVFNRRLATLPNDIIISFNYRTNIDGYISFFFSLKTAFMICERLVPGIGSEYFDEDHLDILGELGNMISGNTISKLQAVEGEVWLEAPHLSAFHQLLAVEKEFFNFSCNFDIEGGKMGVLFGIRKSSVV